MRDISKPALSEDEMNRLGELLDSFGPTAMNIEMLDGYFTALICGPDVVEVSDCMVQVFDEEKLGDFTYKQTTELLDLLFRHWDTIASTLHKSLEDKEELYMPVLLLNEQELVQGNDWANGFEKGMQYSVQGWDDLVNDEEHGWPLIPIFLLVHEHDPDPELRSGPIDTEKREEAIRYLIAGLPVIYRFFEPRRRVFAEAPSAFRRKKGLKIGRNEPCPCGSGRKYKHCCLLNATGW